MKSFQIAAALFVVAFSNLSAQEFQPLILTKPNSARILNRIGFELSDNALTKLHMTKGEKISFNVPHVIINADTIRTDRVRIRGNTSSYLRRKSLKLKLEDKAVIQDRLDSFSVKELYAISLNMDRNYIRNRVASSVLRSQNVAVPANCFAEVTINQKTEGIYLIFFPPDDYAMKRLGAAVVIRRGYQGSIDDLVASKRTSKPEAEDVRKKFASIYRVVIRKYKGEELYNQLGSILDTDGYFRWLAFNHLFQNGDYSDEVYFAWNPELGKFVVCPWDFDDLLHKQPHEGLETRNALIADKLIFSAEDRLDLAIANDPYVYNKYLQAYSKFLNDLTPSLLGTILQQVYEDVYPYYQSDEIIRQSQYDQYGLTTESELVSDLQAIYNTVGVKLISISKQIKSIQTAKRPE